MASALNPATDLASPVLLRVEGLTAHFGAIRALEGIDLEIRAGELVALAGENGAGKSTLVRCIAGDIAPSGGRITIAGQRLAANPAAVARRGVAVVWQDLSLCENLDVAANLLLGHESGGLLRSPTGMHLAAARQLRSLGIPIHDTTRTVSSLSGGQRQLLAVARAMVDRPQLLILDEPTASLGVNESAQVEQLTVGVRERGTSVLLVSHDIDQMFRLADRIIVLRHGRRVADVATAQSHPDEVVALISGQLTDSSARRQLSRLHGLADRLVSADPSSSLPLILSALAGALGADRLCIHLLDGDSLYVADHLGLSTALRRAWAKLPLGSAGGPVGLAAAGEQTVVDHDIRSSAAWAPWQSLALTAGIGSSWAVPVIGANGLAGVITVFRRAAEQPPRDELDLVTLYAGYAANAVERERLLGEVTARNRVLETIQEVLETLAGPVPLTDGLIVVLQALCLGLQADQVALLGTDDSPGYPQVRAAVDVQGTKRPSSAAMLDAAGRALSASRRDGARASYPRTGRGRPPRRHLSLPRRGERAARALGHDRTRRCDGAARGRGQLAAPRPRAPGVRARPPGGLGAAPFAGAAARFPRAPQPRASHAADGDPRVRLEPDADRRRLGCRVRAALPQPYRRRVLAARPPGRRPAGLLGDRVLDDAPGSRLVRSHARARRRRRLPAAGGRGEGVGELRSRSARRVGRPRPARAGLRQPARECPAAQPATGRASASRPALATRTPSQAERTMSS